MGVSTDAILAYGYDLGGGDEWQVRELDEYGGLIPDTGGRVPDPEVEDDYDLIGLAERHLLDASGFTETYEDGREGYFGRERAAKEALGVEFETYCSDSSPMYLSRPRCTRSRGATSGMSGRSSPKPMTPPGKSGTPSWPARSPRSA